MKIVNGKHHEIKRFCDIDTGTVFMLDNEQCYMKTSDSVESQNFAVYHAVRLTDGITFRIFDSRMVIPVDCELIIK